MPFKCYYCLKKNHNGNDYIQHCRVIIWTLNCHCTNPIRWDILQLIGVLPMRMAFYITPVYTTQFWFYDTPHRHTWLYGTWLYSSVASALWFAKHVAWFIPLQTLQRAVTDSHTNITTRGPSPTNACSSFCLFYYFERVHVTNVFILYLYYIHPMYIYYICTRKNKDLWIWICIMICFLQI